MAHGPSPPTPRLLARLWRGEEEKEEAETQSRERRKCYLVCSCAFQHLFSVIGMFTSCFSPKLHVYVDVYLFDVYLKHRFGARAIFRRLYKFFFSSARNHFGSSFPFVVSG